MLNPAALQRKGKCFDPAPGDEISDCPIADTPKRASRTIKAAMLQFTTFPLYREKAEDVTMHDVLALLPLPDNDFLWRILFLKAIGEAPGGASMQDFEKSIRVGPEGYRSTWKNLLKFSLAMEQTWDCLIVATDPGVAIKKDTLEEDGFPNCHYMIEVFDSGNWTVGALSQAILDRLSVFQQD